MLHSGTKKELLELLKRNGSVSVDETVQQTGLAKATLREHFSQLERDGYVERTYKASGRGRPCLSFQLSEKGNKLFPSQEADLIKDLFAFLKARGEEHTIEEFFKRMWDDRFLKIKKQMNGSSDDDLEAKVKALADVLEEDGFMPEIELNGQAEMLNVKQCNCPFSDAVRETRLPCKLEAMFLRKLFNQPIKRTSYIAEGDFACNYEISVNQKNNDRRQI